MAVKNKVRPSKKSPTKKPKWSATSYKKIEARRTELGYSKSAMALALGVTNSTYHNWRRGTTVPHVNQQEQIRDQMAGLTAGTKTPKDASVKRVPKRGRKSPGTTRKAIGDVSGGNTPMHNDSPTHPLSPSSGDPVPGIAAITGAWISAQRKAPSAGSVYEFVRGLKATLAEG